MVKNLIIRSSSAEFLIFERQSHDKGIQVRFEDGDLWLTQKAIGELYNCSIDNVPLHLKNIYNDFELDKNSTAEKFSIVQKEGNRNVKRNVQYYNLDAVISAGYRVNSDRAIQFRRWATYILKEFSKKGYIIDKKLNMKMVKTLFLCNRQKTDFYLFITCGNKRFDSKKFSSELEIARVSFAEESLMNKMLGTKIGAATIFSCLIDSNNKVKIVIDEDVLKEVYYGCSDGTTTGYMKIKVDDIINKVLPYSNHKETVIEM